MSIYWLITKDKSRIENTYSFYNVKPENLESPEKMAEDAFNQGSIAPEDVIKTINEHIEKEKPFVENIDMSPVKLLGDDERNRRNELRKKLFVNLSETYIDKIKYGDHVTRDYGYRYFSEGIMHTTADADADKKFNDNVTELIEMAQRGEFRDDALATMTPDTLKKREEFIQLHRDYLKTTADMGKVFLEASKNGLTDEFLVEKADIIVKAGLVSQQFSNIEAEFNSWGITDTECTKIMDDAMCYSKLNEHATHRLSYIASTGYPYISYDDASRVQMISEETDEITLPKSFEAALIGSSTAKVSAFGAEYKCIEDMLVSSGYKREDVEYIDPTKEGTVYAKGMTTFGSIAMAGHKEIVFTVKGHHDITVPIHLSEDMPLAKGDVIQRFGNEELKKPEKPGFFSRLFNGIHKLIYGTPSKTFREYEHKLNQYEDLKRIGEAAKTLKERNAASKDSKEAEAKEKEKRAVPEKQLDVYQQIAKIAKEACKPEQTKEDIIRNLTELTNLTRQNAKNEKITASGMEISKVISKRIARYNEGKADAEKIVLDEATQSEANRLYTYKGNSKNASLDKTIEVPTVRNEKKLSNETVMTM